MRSPNRDFLPYCIIQAPLSYFGGRAHLTLKRTLKIFYGRGKELNYKKQKVYAVSWKPPHAALGSQNQYPKKRHLPPKPSCKAQ